MKFKEIKKMNETERKKKLQDLKTELIKSKTGTQKTGSSKSREIRKMMARLHTLNNKKIVGKNK